MSEPDPNDDPLWDPSWGDPPGTKPASDPEDPELAARRAALAAYEARRSLRTKRIVGIVMSIIVPGTGHLALGRKLRGAGWFVAALAITLLLSVSVELFIAALVGSVVLCCIDVFFIKTSIEQTPEWIAIALIWFGAFLVANFVRGQVSEHWVGAYRVPTASMEPAIKRGDSVVVDKRDRGSVGDAVIFNSPCESKQLAARIVAGPGDRVEVRCGTLHVNGVAQPLEPRGACSYLDYDEAAKKTVTRQCTRYTETLGGRRHDVVFTRTRPGTANERDFPRAAAARPRCDELRPAAGTIEKVEGSSGACAQTWRFVVPAGHVFVMRDNRDEAADSRTFGPVPSTSIVGRITEVWWSSGPNGLRLGRIGTNIE